MNSTKKTSLLIGKIFWLLLYFSTPIIPILFIYNSNTAKFSDTRNFIAMIAGTVGFVWLVYEFVLSSKPKFIEKDFCKLCGKEIPADHPTSDLHTWCERIWHKTHPRE